MSERVEWKDSYVLGIPEIDNQHRHLIDVANELYEIAFVKPEKYKESMAEVLKKIVDYTVYHFSSEEEYMKSKGYAASDVHKAAHDGFIKEVEYQLKKLVSDDVLAGAKFYSFICNWILTHIAKADKIWATFVLSNK